MILIICIIGILLFIGYFIFCHYTNLYLPCFFHSLTGLWCFCCGGTRMFLSIFKKDFKQAFYYNQFLFVSLPLFLILGFDFFISLLLKRKPLLYKIPKWVYISYVIMAFIFMILRNIFLFFAPRNI